MLFAGSAAKLFSLCDDYADNARKKAQIWPLQNAALILCPVSAVLQRACYIRTYIHKHSHCT